MTSFRQFMEYDDLLNCTAILVLEKNIDSRAVQGLADDLNEGILGAIPRMAGGLTGAALGSAVGPAGAIPAAMAGSALGGKVSDTMGKFFKGGQAPQIGQAFNQAKSAVSNLMSTMAAIQQQTKNPEINGVMQQGQVMQKALADMEPMVPQVDTSLKTTHDTQARSQGGIAQGLQGFGQKLQGKQPQTGTTQNPIMAQAVDEPANSLGNTQYDTSMPQSQSLPQSLPQQKQSLWQKMKGAVGKGVEKFGNITGKVDAFNKAGGVRGAISNVADKATGFAQAHPNMTKMAVPATAALAGYGLGQYMHGGTGMQPDYGPNHLDHQPTANDFMTQDNNPLHYNQDGSQSYTADNAGQWDTGNDQFNYNASNSGQWTGGHDAVTGNDADQWTQGAQEPMNFNNPHTIKNMSDDQLAQLDQGRRQVTIDNGNPDPGPRDRQGWMNYSQNQQHQNAHKMNFVNKYHAAHR